MKAIKVYLKPNYIFVILFAAFIGFSMLYMNNRAESQRKAESNYSEGWTLNGNTTDTDSIRTKGENLSISKKLPETIQFNDSLCFLSSNAFFDVFIGNKLVYSYIQPKNFSGYGYGIAYHAINLSQEQEGEIVRIDIRGALPGNAGGMIRMMSLENSAKYFNRLASGQIWPFIVSTSILIIGILVLLFSLLFSNLCNEINTFALAIAAIIIGSWLAIDTGFLRLVTNSILFSRNLYYICMHLCALPTSVFLYSTTKERNKKYLLLFFSLTAVYLIMVLISRFVFNIDMAKMPMTQAFFIYILLIIIITLSMIYTDHRYCKAKGIKRNMKLYFIGIASLFTCALADCILYLCMNKSVSGYSTFSRIGFYIFFLSMIIESVRMWARQYNSLWKYGYVDELTRLGNRRAYTRFEESNKDVYPYGYVICDANGLKMINDTYGHKQGDELIQAVALRMSEVFGYHNVFRVGGDEYIAYSFKPTIEEFNKQIDKARQLLSGEEVSASVGGVYAPDASVSPQEIKKKAEKIMYEEKRKYYANHKDRRR
ncbi:MAG: GGDEF domain-containing protein [Lachnospiraceae bacterium]|nr:GGDEF domain-containing protein [Lachnospiraceae bacterium]